MGCACELFLAFLKFDRQGSKRRNIISNLRRRMARIYHAKIGHDPDFSISSSVRGGRSTLPCSHISNAALENKRLRGTHCALLLCSESDVWKSRDIFFTRRENEHCNAPQLFRTGKYMHVNSCVCV